MDLDDLDEDEFAHLAQWVSSLPLGSGPVDLSTSAAWKFAHARLAVESGEITSFPDIGM